MNEFRLRSRLSKLGVRLSLNDRKDGIILTGAAEADIPKDLRDALPIAEAHFVRSELHRTAWNFVAGRLGRNDGPGPNPSAIEAFGADGRYELLAQTWTTGTLEDFKATLRACIDAAIEASDSPTPDQDNLSHRPETVPAEIQLPFFT